MKKLTNVMLCLVFFICSYLISFFFGKEFFPNKDISIVVELKTETADEYQLFYDTGNDFSEKESIKKEVLSSDDFQKVNFSLLSSQINRLRIDLGTKPITILLKDVYLQKGNARKAIKSEFVLNNDIGNVVATNDITEITSIGIDPFLYTNDISDLYRAIYGEEKAYFSYIVISLILTGMFMVFLQGNNTQVHRFTSHIAKNIKPISLIVIFVSLIFIPFSFNMLKKQQEVSDTENRVLTPRPEIHLSSINSFPKEFEKYFNDNFAFRSQLLKINNQFKVKFLRTSPNPLVVIGKDQWLFYTGDKAPESMDDYLGTVRFSDEELEIIKDNLETRKNWLNQRGISYLYCIAPNKQSIYSEYLPNHLIKVNNETRTDQLIKYLNDNSDVQVLDLRKVLLENKKDELLYYKSDTHWNEFGAYLGYREIIQELSKTYPELKAKPISNFLLSRSFNHGGDIANMLGMKNQYIDSYIHLEPQFQIFSSDLDIDKSKYPNPAQLIAKQTKNSGLHNMVMFRDSFSTLLIPLLSEHFNKSIYIWDHQFNAKVIEQESPEIVIEEVVERFLPTLLLPNPAEIK